MDESLLLALYSADGMQKVDGLAIEGIGIPGGHLMERAGLAVATEILERYEPEEVVVFSGKGNNGGDGFVVARELFDQGVEVTVFLLAPPEEYKGDARLNLEILGRLGVDVRPATDEGGALHEDTPVLTEMADVVVDAVFGTGFTGAAKGPAATVIQLMNDAPGAVVSVDIMSGVGASNGSVHGPAVIADLTVTLHAAKVGHFVTPGGAFSGEVVVAPIGIPSLCDQDPKVWLLTDEAVGELVIPKGSLDHKRSVGTVLVAGGSKGMEGAAHMAAFAALRGGAGLVHVALPEGAGAQKPFAEVITVTVPGEDGQFGMAARSALFEQAGQLKAAAVGPGFGRTDGAQALVRELLAERTAPTVITPHEGELGRLIGRPADEVAAQRLECAVSAAHRGNVTVVLKGEGTIVADPSGVVYVVPVGNPGLATPGTGDVLSGVITAQLAKGLPATDAACLGAYLHGLAADLASEEAVGTDAMVASDLFHYLPAAVERLKAGPQEESNEHNH
jgi:NAD(P)H-hydrate epimerase